MTVPVTIGILAVGRSRRMRGRDKLLEDVNGLPLLRHVVDMAARVPDACTRIAVSSEDRARHAALEGASDQIVVVADATKGMGHSIATLADASTDTALLLVFADMPDITAEDLQAMITAFHDAGSDHIIRAVDANGTPGHPVIFPPRLLPELRSLTGDQGPRDLLKREGCMTIRVPGATTDLDTPNDWVKWRARRSDANRE